MNRALKTLTATLLCGLVLAIAPAASATVAPTSHGWCNSSRTLLSYLGYVDVPSIGTGTTHCTMSRGANSRAVEVLQYALKYCNLRESDLEVDGDFGVHTRDALKRFQASVGITADGVYGPQTRNNLRFLSNDWIYCTYPYTPFP